MGRILVAVVVVLVGCPRAEIASPRCRTEARVAETTDVGNAGCLVRLGGRMLVIRHRVGGKLGIPGGHARTGETSACTAHRETWEETGVDVVVGSLLRTFENGFRLYACSAPRGIEAGPIAVPPQARSEVTAIEWLHPRDLRDEDWRFPESLEETRQLALGGTGG